MYAYTRSDFLKLNNRPDKLDPQGVVRGEKPFRTLLALPIHDFSADYRSVRFEVHTGFDLQALRQERLVHGLWYHLSQGLQYYFGGQVGFISFTLYEKELYSPIFGRELDLHVICGYRSSHLLSLVTDLVKRLVTLPGESAAYLQCEYSPFRGTQHCSKGLFPRNECLCNPVAGKQRGLKTQYLTSDKDVRFNSFERYIPLYWRTGRLPTVADTFPRPLLDPALVYSQYTPLPKPVGTDSIHEARVPARVLHRVPLHPESEWTYACLVEIHAQPGSVSALHSGLSAFLPAILYDIFRGQLGTLQCVVKVDGITSRVFRGRGDYFTGEEGDRSVRDLIHYLSHLETVDLKWEHYKEIHLCFYFEPRVFPCTPNFCHCKKRPRESRYCELFSDSPTTGKARFDFKEWLSAYKKPTPVAPRQNVVLDASSLQDAQSVRDADSLSGSEFDSLWGPSTSESDWHSVTQSPRTSTPTVAHTPGEYPPFEIVDIDLPGPSWV